MVPIMTVSGPFHARVIAARLGAAGVVCQVGAGSEGPYPLAGVDVLVPESEVELARQLLAADAAEAEAEARTRDLAARVDDVFLEPSPVEASAGTGRAGIRPAAALAVAVAVLLTVACVTVLVASAGFLGRSL